MCCVVATHNRFVLLIRGDVWVRWDHDRDRDRGVTAAVERHEAAATGAAQLHHRPAPQTNHQPESTRANRQLRVHNLQLTRLSTRPQLTANSPRTGRIQAQQTGRPRAYNHADC